LKRTVPPEKLGVAEVVAVEDSPVEVEDRTLPRHRSVLFEMRSDDPHDRVAHFTDGLEGQSLRFGSVLVW
jgi:hypothetical protein